MLLGSVCFAQSISGYIDRTNYDMLYDVGVKHKESYIANLLKEISEQKTIIPGNKSIAPVSYLEKIWEKQKKHFLQIALTMKK
ncbi:hypothetical protein Dip510_000562 [Elusimicrobium posterum]